MRKKMPKILLGALGVMFATTINAYAGQWVQNSTGWWYDNGNGTWPANSWQWIDGNNDGIAECYYFDMYGYMLANTTTPDGYTVDGNGAWTVNGAIQTRSVSVSTSSANNETNKPSVDVLTLTPTASMFFDTFENARTSQNLLWSKGFRLSGFSAGSSAHGYVEYFVDGAYSTLSFTAAPSSNTPDWYSAWLEVYGDDDELLWSSDTIDYKTDPIEAIIDISGQRYVSIHTGRIEGNDTDILFKNVIFK